MGQHRRSFLKKKQKDTEKVILVAKGDEVMGVFKSELSDYLENGWQRATWRGRNTVRAH
ncbi:MAG: hypothetical protein ABI425_02195 [Patescibacteria group bacterium]